MELPEHADWGSPLRNALEKDTSVIFVLDRDLRIIYCNQAWDRFALENGGAKLIRERIVGSAVMDAVPAPLKNFYQSAYRGVQASHAPWEYQYQCASAVTYRRLRMAIVPGPEAGELVVVNSILVERPHEHDGLPPDEAAYRDGTGIVTMCSHCRRVRRVAQPALWDWVPRYAHTMPPGISHGLCEVCLELYYPNV